MASECRLSISRLVKGGGVALSVVFLLVLLAEPARAQYSLYTPDPARRQEVADWIASHPELDAGYPCDNQTPVGPDGLPACFMLEDTGVVSFERPRNQGGCYSCPIFALVGAMEIELGWRYHLSLEALAIPAGGGVISLPFGLDLSEWQLGMTRATGQAEMLCDEVNPGYGDVEQWFPALGSTGTLLEQFNPYPKGLDVWSPPDLETALLVRECSGPYDNNWPRVVDQPASLALPGAVSFKIDPTGIRRVETALQIKRALLDGHAVVALISADWGSSLESCIYANVDPDTGLEVGTSHHAVVIVGYWDNDPTHGADYGGTWLVKNAWRETAPVFIPYQRSGEPGPGRCLLGRESSGDSTGTGLWIFSEVYADTPEPNDPNAVDTDGDGVPDWVDNCAGDVNSNQGDLDQDGAGDACDSDRDGDSVAAPYDCDDRAPFILEDLDGDGRCDRPAQVPFNRDELQCTDCQDCCAQLLDHWAAEGVSYCVPCCELRCQQAPDNCAGGSDPSCIRARAAAVPGTRGMPDPPDYDPPAEEQACRGMYYNPYQWDSDDNGVGDFCQAMPVASNPRLGGHEVTTTLDICGPSCLVLGGCVSPDIRVSFKAEALDPGWPPNPPSPGGGRPVTIGACGCPGGNGWDQNCKERYCPEYGERGAQFPNSPAYRPVFSGDCDAMGELPDRWPRTDYHPDFVAAGGPPAPDECKIRPVPFSHDRPENQVSVTWDWLGHPSVIPLPGQEIINRIAYPPPSDYEYTNCTSGEVPICDRQIKAFPDVVPQDERTFTNVVQLPQSAGRCFGLSFNLDVMSPHIQTRIIPHGPLRPREGGWAFVGEPALGDVALLTLDQERFTARAVHRVALQTPSQGHPAFDRAAMAAARWERGLVGLAPGKGSVLFALGGVDSAGSPDQALWAGDLAGSKSVWQRVAGSPSVGGNWLQRPFLAAQPGAGRLVVVAEAQGPAAGLGGGSGDEPPSEALAHVVYELTLGEIEWRALGSLALPAGLRGYSVVHLPWQGRLLVLGGREGRAYSEALYEVSLADLSVTRLPDDLPAAALRERATATLAPNGRDVIIFGGVRQEAGLDDLWLMDLVSGAFTRVAEAVPGAQQGFVAGSASGQRIMVAAAPNGADPSPRLVAVDRLTGAAQVQTLVNLRPPPPGSFSGQVQGGATRVFPVTVPSGIAYPGQLLLATLDAAKPGLRLRVFDGEGDLLGQDSRDGTSLQVAWLGQPGEAYLLAVGPGPGYVPGVAVGFQIRVTEGDAAWLGSYRSGHPVDRVDVAGEIAWLSGPWGVQAVSLAEPAGPLLLDEKHVAGPVQGLALAADRACVARTLRPRGLWCLDAADPTDLHWGGPAVKTLGMGRSLASTGEIGYVAEGLFGVGIYHLGEPGPPRRPSPLGRLWPGGLAIHASVHGGRLYVSLLGGDVLIYRLGDPAVPVLLGTIPAGDPVAGIAVHGGSAHLHRVDPAGLLQCLLGLRCPRGEVVEVFDVSDPAAPLKQGEYDTTSTLPWAYVKTLGHRLLVPGGTGFEVLEVRPLEVAP